MFRFGAHVVRYVFTPLSGNVRYVPFNVALIGTCMVNAHLMSVSRDSTHRQ